LLAATSCGWAEALDTNEGIDLCAATTRNIFNQLDDASVSFKIFLSALDYGIPIDSMVSDIGAYDNPLAFATINDFQSQASTNSLPEFSLIEPNYESYTARFGGAPNDDHPPANIQRGQLLAYNVVAALMSNEETWKSSALFITYDENGGYYDHYPPPSACEPVKNAPVADYAFDRYGFRVPLIVVSPYVVTPGYVSHRVTDHASIIRFVQAWKNLGALTGRDANAWPLLDIFNFAQTPTPAPDISQHTPPAVDAVREASCPEK
jgi:phospholipase C